MKFPFEDESFAFETLRSAGFANYGGADLGEVLVTARAIPAGDEGAWHAVWKRAAERAERIGEEAASRGHAVSAREAWLRATNYYRTAELYLRDDPARDAEAEHLSARSREAFASAAGLMDRPVWPVAIPYERTTLPGYFFSVDDSGEPRPTIVFNGGFDSTLEEAYFAIGAAALRRGYNVLAFDGPGQGAALREQGLHFRHDWEEVVRPVIDVALTIPEVAPDRIALVGYSLGSYLAARAAAFEHRIAALILHGGVFDYHQVSLRAVPPWLADWIMAGRDDVALPVTELLMSQSTSLRWALRNGRWAFGATSVLDYARRTRQYTLEGVIDRIEAPTLVLDAENDQFFRGEARRVATELSCPHDLVTLPEAEDAGEHAHAGSLARFHQMAFDWLDETMRPLRAKQGDFELRERDRDGLLVLNP
jgi:pimeloyl-ACP methyl ester carboxylesterase